MDFLIFDNEWFETRTLNHNVFGWVIIATTDLSIKLISDDGAYFSEEARIIDEEIFYYIEPYQMKLSNSELHNLVTREVK